MKVAFVAPFFGARAAGGAEAECRHTALRLAAAGVEVEVLTTCLLDQHHDWNVNYHRKGTHIEDGLRVHRFPVEYADLAPFFRFNERLAAGERLSPEEERQFISLFVNSFDLYRALSRLAPSFDWVCFIPYLFGTTVFGSLFCPGRTVLIPCLHDEPYARMTVYRELFHRADRIVFHSPAEQELAKALYGIPDERCFPIGEGVETDFPSDAARFRERYDIRRPFVLYAGKKEETKNTPLLIDYFRRFKQRHAGDLALVLIGPGRVAVPPDLQAHVYDLGYLPEQDKRDAYSAASVLCQPSVHESFSLVLMEAWCCGVPALVHGGCAVTRGHVVQSGGGLYFESCADFEGCLLRLLHDADLARLMGLAGQAYVRRHFAWSRIVERYQKEVFRRDEIR